MPKPIIYILLGALIGGIIGALVAYQLRGTTAGHTPGAATEVLMSDMTRMLRDKRGDEFDSMFIEHMIEHHQAAVDMANLSAERAKHDEIKKLSADIISAQEAEIRQMRDWQRSWGYEKGGHSGHAGH